MRVPKWFWLATLGMSNLALAQKVDQVQKLQPALQRETTSFEAGRASPAAPSAVPQEEKISATAPSRRLAILREDFTDPVPSSQRDPAPATQLQPALKKELKPE